MDDVVNEPPDLSRMIREGRHEDFLRTLGEAAARARIIAARRPTWDQLAHALLQFRTSVYLDLLQGEDGPLSPIALLQPTQGALLEVESAALASRRLNPGHELLRQQLTAYAGALVDHLGGMAALMLADQPMRPALVLARVLLDAGAQVLYLLDPAADAEQRTVRAANIRLEGLAAELEDLRGTPDSDAEVQELREAMDKVWADGEADGLERARSRKGEKQRYFEPAPPSGGGMAELALPGLGSQMWRLLSSVVHAQDRPMIQFITGRGDIGQEVQGRSYGAMYTGAGVIAATEAASRLAGFYGLNGDRIAACAAALHDLWAGASGMNDS